MTTVIPFPSLEHFGYQAALYASIGSAFPLPAGKKFPPPSGLTGINGRDADADDHDAWTPHDGNLGLRLADGVVAIDIDHYADKTGADTIAALEEELGELPPTFVSTRRDPAVSGQRLYRYGGGRLAGTAGTDVDVVQHGHRYMACYPSVVDGATYVWYGPDGEPAHRPPMRDELPVLPEAWEAHLRAGASTTAATPPAAPADRDALVASLEADDRELSPAVEAALDRAIADWNRVSKGSHHDTMLAAVMHITGVCSRGSAGYAPAIDALWTLWHGYTIDRDDEMQAMIDSAAARAAADLDDEHEPVETTAEDLAALRRRVRDSLALDDKGRPHKTTSNLDKIFAEDPVLRHLATSTMDGSHRWRQLPPWRAPGDVGYMTLTDGDRAHVAAVVLGYWGGSVTAIAQATITQAVTRALDSRAYSPWCAYVDALPAWDGVRRLETAIPAESLAGGETEYTRRTLAGFFLGMMQRSYEPGCQLDAALILVGTQGTRKTSWLRAIVPDGVGLMPPHEAEVVPDQSRHRDANAACYAAPIVIFDEIDKLASQWSQSALKAFITARHATWRSPYGHGNQTWLRHFVVAGTTNELRFLKDVTGNRRYRPVELAAPIPSDHLSRQHMDKLLAEARDRYRAGERMDWSAEYEAMAEEMRTEHLSDPIGDLVHDWVDSLPLEITRVNAAVLLAMVPDLAGTQRRTREGQQIVAAVAAAMDRHPDWAPLRGRPRCGDWPQDRAGTWQRVDTDEVNYVAPPQPMHLRARTVRVPKPLTADERARFDRLRDSYEGGDA